MTDTGMTLVERIEAAEVGSRELDAAIWFELVERLGPGEQPDRDMVGRWPAYTTSIDAAVALAERVLPGWLWNVVSADRLHGTRPCAFLAAPEDNGAPEPWAVERDVYSADASTPALALVAAVLRAKEGEG